MTLWKLVIPTITYFLSLGIIVHHKLITGKFMEEKDFMNHETAALALLGFSLGWTLCLVLP